MSQPIARPSIENCITSSSQSQDDARQSDDNIRKLFEHWENGDDFLSSLSDVEEDCDGDNTFGDVDGRVADHFKAQRDRRMSTRRSSIAAFGAKLNATRCERSNKHVLELLNQYYEKEQYKTMLEEEVTIELPIDFDNLTFSEAIQAVVELSEQNERSKEQLPKACAVNHSKDLENMLKALKENYDGIMRSQEEPSQVESTSVSKMVGGISKLIENIKRLQLVAREKLEELEILRSIERV